MFTGPPLFARGQFKPSGPLSLGPRSRGMPSGLRFMAPFMDLAYTSLPAGRTSIYPTKLGSVITLANTAWGMGAKCTDITGSTNIVTYKAEALTRGAMDVLFVCGALTGSITRSLCGFNDSSDGTNSSGDKQIYFNTSNQINGYIFDGGQKVATDTTTTFTAGNIYHVCITFDATTLRLYVNGKQTQSTAAGAAQSLTTPFFCNGAFTIGPGAVNAQSSATILASSYANNIWTSAEVAARSRAYFDFLDTADDMLADMVAGIPMQTNLFHPTIDATGYNATASDQYFSWRTD